MSSPYLEEDKRTENFTSKRKHILCELWPLILDVFKSQVNHIEIRRSTSCKWVFTEVIYFLFNHIFRRIRSIHVDKAFILPFRGPEVPCCHPLSTIINMDDRVFIIRSKMIFTNSLGRKISDDEDHRRAYYLAVFSCVRCAVQKRLLL